MLNKILSKKIKFPLSLRGAKQRSNLSGFSLIELMVAVGILAIAIFGIFYAFSAGFMGMADARDRTVATNYAREAMEDIKNMDFELITNSNIGTTVLIEGKYYRSVTIIDVSPNLKRIITRVYWKNRKDETVDVTTETIVNYIQFYAGEASKIVLYAEPYATLLPSDEGNEIEITAIIKDKQGNTKTDWEGDDIVFSISGGDVDLVEIIVGSTTNTTNGIARTTLRATGALEVDGVTYKEGTVIIQASINDGAISNSINIIVTLGVTRIDLTVNPDSIPADGSTQSTIIAFLKDAYGNTVNTATNDITFSITGPGSFVGYDSDIVTLSTLDSNGVPTGKATIDIISISGNPGLITITASSEGLFNGNINVVSYGDPTSIYVIASTPEGRNFIYDDGIDKAIIKVTILDQNSNPIPYSGIIYLSATDDEGNTVGPGFVDNSLDFLDERFRFTDFTCSKAGVINISATDTYNGIGLNTGNTTVMVEPLLVPNSISLTAVPANLLAGNGDSSNSTITATVKSNSTIVATYDGNIRFSLTPPGTGAYLFYNDDKQGEMIELIGSDYESDGVAEIKLFPGSSTVGTAIIRVSIANPQDGDDITDEITVSFYSAADKIVLIASPQNIPVNSGCTLKASVKDKDGFIVSDYNENITFTIVEGNPLQIKFSDTGSSNLTLIKPFNEGEVSILLKSQNKAGTAIIVATSLELESEPLHIPVGIDVVLAEPDIICDVNLISFLIDIQGADLLLEQIYFWTENQDDTLLTIEIDDDVAYDGEVTSPATVDLIGSPVTLSEGVHTVELHFVAGTTFDSGEKINVIFNPNSGNFGVDFLIP